MIDTNKWIAEAKDRLAISERTHRPGSAVDKVAALLPEIQAARAAGKTWRQIAVDLSDGDELNTDAVRVAFGRCHRHKQPSPSNRKKQPSRSRDNKNSVPTKIEQSVADNGFISDMFAPMFDARDTDGRRRNQGAGQEELS